MDPRAFTGATTTCEPELLADILIEWEREQTCAIMPGCHPPRCGRRAVWRLTLECYCPGGRRAVVCGEHGDGGDPDLLALHGFNCCRCEDWAMVVDVEPL